MHQVIFTTELLHSDSDQAVTQDSKNYSSQRKSEVSLVDRTGEAVSVENNACINNTSSAHTDATTNERKPSQIAFKDYFADSVCYLLVRFQDKSMHCVL